MSDFTFKKGTFVQLKANSTIHLGRLERNIYEGDIVEFDGFSLKFNGSQTDMPELKAGLKRGWLALVEGDVSEPVAEIAPAPVAPAKKEMPVQTVYDEERAVAEVKPKVEEAPKKFPLVVESQDDDIRPVAKVENKSGAEIAGASSAGDGVAEAQGAESVSTIKLKTAANTKTVISDGSQASAEISKLDNMQASVTKVATEDAVVKEDVVDEEDELFSDLEFDIEEDEEDDVDDQDLENAQILQAIDGDVDPSQGAVAVGKDNSKIKVLPGGVEWDTSKHWSKRAKIALEMYGDDQATLEAIMAVETKGVITAIQKGIAEG
jgi:hypothetical protein